MLELKNISLCVEDEKSDVAILQGINFEFLPHNIYVITGPNGGGKSSLSKVLMGIYKPSQGKIYYKGQDITGLSITERARLGISYGFQQPPKFKGIKIKEFLRISGGDGMNMVTINNLLLKVGLCPKDYINREMDGSLSGGELKRLEIASILARNADVAIFDEPEAGIDLWSFQRLAETFKVMHEKSNKCIIIISHQERILNLADEIILVKEGQIQKIPDKENFMKTIIYNNDCQCSDYCKPGGGEEQYVN